MAALRLSSLCVRASEPVAIQLDEATRLDELLRNEVGVAAERSQCLCHALGQTELGVLRMQLASNMEVLSVTMLHPQAARVMRLQYAQHRSIAASSQWNCEHRKSADVKVDAERHTAPLEGTRRCAQRG